jgi:hypothetical protein
MRAVKDGPGTMVLIRRKYGSNCIVERVVLYPVEMLTTSLLV